MGESEVEFVASRHRKGSNWLKYNNYLYSINRTSEDKCVRYYSCIRQSICYARLTVKRSSVDSDDWRPIQIENDNHNEHGTEEAELIKTKFTAICERMIEESPKAVVSNVYKIAMAELSLTEPADLIALIEPYKSFRHHLGRKKRRIVGPKPKIPRTARRPSTRKTNITPASSTSTASADTTTATTVPTSTAWQRTKPLPVRNVEGATTRANAFEVVVNVEGYSARELSVKIIDGFVTVSGKHEVKLDDSYTENHFTRSYKLPANANLTVTKSTLCPGGKILKVTVPLTVVVETNELTIPIEVMTSPGEASTNTVDQYILNLFN
ncbi:Protein lethal(2)essential for life [Halotydeus destructor]|nr:Protein lethal(2)essential for life [Halotydeus destructor]